LRVLDEDLIRAVAQDCGDPSFILQEGLVELLRVGRFRQKRDVCVATSDLPNYRVKNCSIGSVQRLARTEGSHQHALRLIVTR